MVVFDLKKLGEVGELWSNERKKAVVAREEKIVGELEKIHVMYAQHENSYAETMTYEKEHILRLFGWDNLVESLGGFAILSMRKHPLRSLFCDGEMPADVNIRAMPSLDIAPFVQRNGINGTIAMIFYGHAQCYASDIERLAADVSIFMPMMTRFMAVKVRKESEDMYAEKLLACDKLAQKAVIEYYAESCFVIVALHILKKLTVCDQAEVPAMLRRLNSLVTVLADYMCEQASYFGCEISTCHFQYLKNASS